MGILREQQRQLAALILEPERPLADGELERLLSLDDADLARRRLRAYVDGLDPLTGRPVMQEVIEGLALPFAPGEGGDVEYDRSTPRLLEPDTAENLERRFHDS